MDGWWREWKVRTPVVVLAVAIAASAILSAETGDGGARQSKDKDGVPVADRQPARTGSPLESQPADASAPAADTEGTDAQRSSELIGSKHDFTEDGRLGRDLCSPCHPPHLAGARPARLDRRITTTQPLRPYRDIDAQLDGWSLLCLGCHDGTTAKDVYSSSHATTVAGQLADSGLGARGPRSHPVGIKYPSAAEGYHPPAAVEAAGLRLPDGRIQCTTCHDAHNTHRYGRMLRISDERSRVCLTCHRL